MPALRISVRPSMVAIRGPITGNRTHRHRALQLSAAVAGRLVLDGTSCRGVVIAAEWPHQLEAADALTVLIEPETRLGRRLTREFLDMDDSRIDGIDLAQLLRVLRVADSDLSPSADPRVRRALTRLQPSRLIKEGGAPVDEIAAELGLSRSRFQHLFRAEVGTSWSRARGWARAMEAARQVASGASLTEAAHAAGYADSAHLSRCFKQMFGLSPSAAANGSTFVQVEGLV